MTICGPWSAAASRGTQPNLTNPLFINGGQVHQRHWQAVEIVAVRNPSRMLHAQGWTMLRVRQLALLNGSTNSPCAFAPSPYGRTQRAFPVLSSQK